jgi:hypothetical protein
LTGVQFTLLPLQQPQVPLALGWYFLKFASPHFGLWLQRAFDEVVASGKYRRILARYGLTTQTLPENPLISPVVVPPRYYSLEQGFIPRVAVPEAFLPKLACVDNTHRVEVVLADETNNSEENNV